MAKEQDLALVTDCSWVRGLDANGNSIRIAKADLVELIRKEMPVATSEKNGLMSNVFFNSIIDAIASIPADGIHDTGIKTGGVIFAQNASSTHEIAVAIMYTSGEGKVIASGNSIDFFNNEGPISIYREDVYTAIKIKNNMGVKREVAYRFICINV